MWREKEGRCRRQDHSGYRKRTLQANPGELFRPNSRISPHSSQQSASQKVYLSPGLLRWLKWKKYGQKDVPLEVLLCGPESIPTATTQRPPTQSMKEKLPLCLQLSRTIQHSPRSTLVPTQERYKHLPRLKSWERNIQSITIWSFSILISVAKIGKLWPSRYYRRNMYCSLVGSELLYQNCL